MGVLKSVAVGATPIPATVTDAKAMVEAALQGQSGTTIVPVLSTKEIPPGGEPPPGVERLPMHRLSAIEIQNYRAYRGTFRLELPRGANLLVYGENGGGKSSLFHTLRVFLEAPSWWIVDSTTKKSRAVSVTDHRHRFTTGEPRVKLEFGETGYEWSETVNHTTHERMRLVNQGKGFLDYKALLEVHYVPSDDGKEIDLFSMLIRRLLPYYTFPFNGKNLEFQVFWRRLNNSVKHRWTRTNDEPNFKKELTAFNEAMENTLRDLGKRASEMLLRFGDEFQVEFLYEKAEFSRYPRKHVKPPRVLVYPAFRKQQLPDYDRFLNEARLSALAICLFLAALKQSPASSLRLLALDDILIGLDMSNRVKVFDLLHEYFANWQILIFTYSKAWFERLKERVKTPGWSADWQAVTLWEEWFDGDTSPIIRVEGSGDALETATLHLARKDYKAAAVYARSALEAACHHICAKANMSVLHVEQAKQRKLEHYLNALAPRLGEIVDTTRRGRALVLLARLEQARAFVLNRNAHFDVEEEDALSGEVGTALETVGEFIAFLNEQEWKNELFHTGQILTPLEQMTAELAAARAAVATNAYNSGRKAMHCAHGWFWQIYGAKLGVMFPLGKIPTDAEIFTAAETLLTPDVKVRLNSVRGYLFGSIKGNKFDATKFEEAAKLLEELGGA